MIHVVTPYDPVDKNLGRAYNKVFENVAENDWVCLMDWDTMFLTPNAIKQLYSYVAEYPDTGIFTCWTNRLHTGARQQLWTGFYEEKNLEHHIWLAQTLIEDGVLKITELTKHISGFVMMISKRVWNEIKFREDMMCLGVDNDYSDRILASGRKILRMDSIYVLHLYRMGMPGGVKDKSHLL